MTLTTKKSSDYKLSTFQRVIELCRPWVILSIYIILAYMEIWWLAIPAALFTCLAGFVQMHDAIHNSLGLSKKTNDVVLTLSAQLLLKTGHGLKVTHLRHHGQCMSDDDPEGAPAKWKLKQVFLNGPYHTFIFRTASLRMAPHTKNIQIFETVITGFILLLFILLYVGTGSIIGLVYWGVAVVLSFLMPFWASYLPHKISIRNPIRLWGVRLARLWTPLISSIAFHHFHHTYPKVPTALLAKAAQELPEPEEHDHGF